MRQFTPTTEVDFVIIGSGAAGGIMAKQLSLAGYSVVVLEQGGWGKYGHEQDWTKDEWVNDHPADDDQPVLCVKQSLGAHIAAHKLTLR